MFTESDFRDFLKMKGVDPVCPCCHSKNWLYFAEQKRNIGGIYSQDPDQNGILGLTALTVDRDGDATDVRHSGVGMASMLCANCGYTMLFNSYFAQQQYGTGN